MTPRTLRPVLRAGLLPAGIAVALAPAVAGAQDTLPTQDATTIDRMEVTGSRIRQVDLETAAPVLFINREQIEQQGFSSVADILQHISAAGAPAFSRTSPLDSAEEVGGSYIDLRNLGPNRTLVLVDGKRLGTSNGGLQDVSSIPLAMVDWIEVLKDGASTIYGSDAIAGVINIITRKNIDGLEASAYIGQYGQGDGTREQYSVVMGSTGDNGRITVGAEFTEEDPVMAGDRWFSRDRFPVSERSPAREGGLAGVSQWGTIIDGPQGSLLGVDPWTGEPVYNTFYTVDRPAGDATDFADFHETTDEDVSNANLASTLYSGLQRRSVFLNGVYDITDGIRFESDMLYSDRESYAQMAGYPYASDLFGTPMSIDSYYNPLGNQSDYAGTKQAVNFWRRGWEVPRGVQSELTTFRFTGELAGAFQVARKYWDWDVGYLFNQNKGVQTRTGDFNIEAVRNAVGPSFLNSQGVVQCGTAANPVPLGAGPGACTPWNPLVSDGVTGQGGFADADVQAYLSLPSQSKSETSTKAYYANLAGSPFTLPAGNVGLAVGFEHRVEDGFFSPDALTRTGGSTTLASGPTRGGYSLDEAYLELLVPLLADVPFAQELSVSFASRYSDYDSFGDTTNSKFGFTWKPVDSVLLRGTWSEGFRAPSVADLYGGAAQDFPFYTDPCDTAFGVAASTAKCRADVPAYFRQPANDGDDGLADGPGTQSPVPFMRGSNPDLTPETSESKTLGVVWSPDFVEGLNLSLDWFNIRIEDTIVYDSPSAILDDCYVRGIASRCDAEGADAFIRDPATGRITSMSYGGRNAGFVETEGYDFDLSYRIQTDYGRFGLAWVNTYVSKNELKADNLDGAPQQLNGFGGNFRLRSNATLSWQDGDFGAGWTARYYSGVKEACYFVDRCSLPNWAAPDTQGVNVALNELPSTIFHDVQFRWNAPWNATVSVGVNNVFENYARPNYDQPNSSYSYYGGFDIGRFMYMKYQQRF